VLREAGGGWLTLERSVAANSATTAARVASGRLLPALLALACVVVTVGATVSPTAALLLAALMAVAALAVTAPAYGFAGALLMFGFEGTIKMRLTVEGAPEPLALGAAAIDLALVVSVLGLLAQDRGQSLRRLWERFGRAERAVAAAFAGWLVLSVLQIPLGGDLIDGLEGARLVHFYLLAIPGGVMLAAQLPPRRVEQALLAIALVIAAYAALRGIAGPTEHEREFAESRSTGTYLGEHPRDTGSFTSPVAMVSFLVPAAIFALVLACLVATRRVLGALVFALAMVGVIASYVRTALIATVAGVALLAAMLFVGRGGSRPVKLVTASMVVLVLAAGYGATLLAGDVDPVAKHRAETLANPFTEYSVRARLDIWDRALDRAVDEPLGTGLGTVGRATIEHGRTAVYTDNSYLKILQEQGFLGALLFLFAVLGAVALCWRRLARAGPASRPLGVAALVAFTTFLLLCVMAEYIEQPGKELVWALLGVATWEAYGR
jgi:O-antigen ligase